MGKKDPRRKRAREKKENPADLAVMADVVSNMSLFANKTM